MNKDIHTHLEKLKNELDKLSPAIMHLQQADENSTALVSAAKRINGEYAVHLKRIEETIKELNDQHHKSIEKEIGNSVTKLNNSSNSIEESYDNFKKLITSLTNEYRLIADATTRLIEKIDKVDFPTRLDKVDATVSSINQGLQNVQQRIGDLERNIKDDLHAKTNTVTGQIDKMDNTVAAQMALLFKENKVMKLMLVASIAISLGSLIFLIIKI